MNYVQPRPYADPDAAAKKLLELANAFEPVQDGRIFIGAINGPKATRAEYKAGLDRRSRKAGSSCMRAARS